MLQFYDFILWLLFWFQLRIDHVLAGFYHHKFPNRRTLGDTSSHFFVAIKTGYFSREVAQSPSEIVASKTGIFNLNRDVFTNTYSCFLRPTLSTALWYLTGLDWEHLATTIFSVSLCGDWMWESRIIMSAAPSVFPNVSLWLLRSEKWTAPQHFMKRAHAPRQRWCVGKKYEVKDTLFFRERTLS